MQNLELHFSDSGLVVPVRDFRVEEAMNRPFEIFLTVKSEDSLDLAGLIGQKARFLAALTPTVQGGDELTSMIGGGAAYSADWSGIIADIEEFGSETTGLSLYRVHLVHPLWVLAQNKNYRVFHELSEFDMARALLDEWGIDDNVLLDATRYKKRDYRIQYGESDLDFVHRNLEDLGISYYLEDTEAGEIITFSAAPEKNEPRAESLRFYDEPPTTTREPWVTGVAVRRAVRAAKYTLQDVDYRFPPERQPRISQEFVRKADEELALRVCEIERALETYEYNPGIFCVEGKGGGDTPVHDRKLASRTDDKYGKWLTEVRLRSVQASRYRIHFETNAFDLHPGAVARIEQHPRAELADPVLVIALSFSGTETGEWTMSCTAHPTKVPYIPEMVTTRPCASGVESATVVGMPGTKIDPQEFGSVLVQFHWDRESKRDDHASCWVPVSYGLAGPGRGMFSLPRLGEEVLVDFLAGDLDKPMVTGRVYTGLNKPWSTDTKKMGDFSIKNDSLDSAEQHTGIHMTADAQPLMHMFSTHDKQLTVGNDERCTVAQNRSRSVGGNEGVKVNRNQTINIIKNQNTTIKQSCTQKVGGAATTLVEGEISIASQTASITMMAAQNVGTITEQFFVAAPTSIVLSCGPSTIVMVPNGIVIDSPMTLINPGIAWTKFIMENGEIPKEPEEPPRPDDLIKRDLYGRDMGGVSDPDSAGAKDPNDSNPGNYTDEQRADRRQRYRDYMAAKEKYDAQKADYKELRGNLDNNVPYDAEKWQTRQKQRNEQEWYKDKREARSDEQWRKANAK